jgi:hypothetical protein
MSSRSGVIIGALLLVLPSAAGAQTADTGYTARLARLTAAYTAAKADVRAQDSVRGTHRDTVRAGVIRVAALPRDTAPVRRAAVRASGMVVRTFGRGAGPLADTVLVAPDSAGWTEAQLTELFVGWAGGALVAGDTATQRWLGGARLDSAAVSRAEPVAYVELVTAPSRAARGCYRGSLDDCRIALGLSDTADVILAAYDAADRRALVNERRSALLDAASAGPFQDCITGADSICVELLRSLSATQVGAPLSPAARATLLGTALDLGGADAFARFQGGVGRPMEERISLAAGVAPNDLILRWRGRVLAARPLRVTTPAPLAFAALGWTLIFGLAATRSSRWR